MLVTPGLGDGRPSTHMYTHRKEELRGRDLRCKPLEKLLLDPQGWKEQTEEKVCTG